MLCDTPKPLLYRLSDIGNLYYAIKFPTSGDISKSRRTLAKFYNSSRKCEDVALYNINLTTLNICYGTRHKIVTLDDIYTTNHIKIDAQL